MKFPRGKWWLVVLALLLTGGVGVVLFYFPPEKYALYPRCAFYSLTGLQCAGCGGLRALHRLLHGDVAGAFAYNPLLVLLLPIFLGGAVLCLVRRALGRPMPGLFQRPLWIWILLGVVLAFGVVRNFFPSPLPPPMP